VSDVSLTHHQAAVATLPSPAGPWLGSPLAGALDTWAAGLSGDYIFGGDISLKASSGCTACAARSSSNRLFIISVHLFFHNLWPFYGSAVV
jgi:hypothetical protein